MLARRAGLAPRDFGEVRQVPEDSKIGVAACTPPHFFSAFRGAMCGDEYLLSHPAGHTFVLLKLAEGGGKR